MLARVFLLAVLSVLFLQTVSSNGQPRISPKTKPEWFWNQPADCGPIAVGFAQHSIMYPENSKKVAREASIHNYLRQKYAEHSGGDAFSVTERGGVWLGGDRKEVYDTTSFSRLMEDLPLLDYQVAGNLSMVASGVESCRDQVENKAGSTRLHRQPGWIRTLPESKTHIYAVGVSEGYYYPSSSWNNAESAARRALAATVHIRVRGLQEQLNLSVSTEVSHSELTVTLRNIAVVSRYHDPQTNLHYVLVRMTR